MVRKIWYLDKKITFVTWQPTIFASTLALFLFAATSVDNSAEYENWFVCEPYRFTLNRSDDSIKQRIRNIFPNSNDIRESYTKDTSYVAIGFKSPACTKGVSVIFNVYAKNSDSCAIKVNQITTVCKGAKVDNIALCRAIEDSIFSKLR